MIGHFEEKNENKEVLDDADENKEVKKKYMKKFDKVLKKKLKRLMVVKNWIWERFLKNSIIMICQWISL